MTTVINSPAPAKESGGMTFLIGIIVLIGFIAVLVYFGVHAITNMGQPQINIPAPQIVMPNKIDVNVQQDK